MLALGQQRTGMVKLLTFAITVATFLLSLPLWIQFDNGSAALQFVENVVWIDALNIHYHLGVNGIAMPLIILTTVITILVILSAWRVINKQP